MLLAASQAEFLRHVLRGRIPVPNMAAEVLRDTVGIPEDLQVTLSNAELATGLAAHLLRYSEDVDVDQTLVDDEIVSYLKRWLPEDAS
jgi:hypothetical protein